ncbi:MAG: glycerophosphodiester phosphodiesterase [Longimicrobiales bacterium]|nr:glycerophosphodiester phosphodiesterase [Longimicrobiales bacterium]
MIGRPLRRPGHPALAGAPLLMAHRGGAALAPENTLEAFELAIEGWGADLIETDVHLTRDGEVIVLHDATVDRTTDGSGRVAELTWREIRELDAGARWVTDDGDRPFAGRGVRIPRLDELLERFPHTRLSIDAKAPDVVVPLAAVVRRHAAEHRVVLAAERHRLRARVSRGWAGPVSAARRDLAAVLLLTRFPWIPVTPRIDLLQIPLRWPVWGRVRTIFTPRLLHEAHRRNLPVHIWTVDDEATMARLLEAGVDGIQTDRPDRLARVLHEWNGRPLPPAAAAPPPRPGRTRAVR